MDKRVDDWIEKVDPQWKQIFINIRELIFQAHPSVLEKFSYQVPFYDCYGMLCYFAIQKTSKNKINGKIGEKAVLGFCRGYQIPDPHGFLSADKNQKYIRHFIIQKNMPDAEILLQYLLSAIDINKSIRNNKNKSYESN